MLACMYGLTQRSFWKFRLNCGPPLVALIAAFGLPSLQPPTPSLCWLWGVGFSPTLDRYDSWEELRGGTPDLTSRFCKDELVPKFQHKWIPNLVLQQINNIKLALNDFKSLQGINLFLSNIFWWFWCQTFITGGITILMPILCLCLVYLPLFVAYSYG